MSLRSRLLSLATAVAVAAVPVAPAVAAPAAPAPGPDVVAGELLVRWAPGASAAARAAERARFGLETAGRELLAGFEHVRTDDSVDPAALAAELRRRGTVADAQPNFVYRPASTVAVDDPDFSKLWGFDQRNDVDLDVPEAWAMHQGSSSVVVAVVDTGVQVSHPDLAANMWANPGEVPGNGKDDDGNGKVDDVHGWDFVSGDATVYDGPSDDHGTHIAGTIAATADNSTGVAGIAPGVRIMSLKFLDHEGKGSTTKAIQAIAYAESKGARVINASWGYAGGGDDALRDAIAGSDAVFVAAAGNAGSDNDVTPFIPAGLDAANIVSVAAITSSGSLASWSNYGDTTVDVGAPGESIYSTYPDGYAYMHGTSMAAPHVAGVAALLASADPTLSVTEVVGLVKGAAAASPLSSLTTTTVTGGMPNAAVALAEVVASASAPTWPSGAELTVSDVTTSGFTVSWPAATDDEAVTAYRVTIGTTAAVSTSGTSYTANGLAEGTDHAVSVVATDLDGNLSAALTTTATTLASNEPIASEPIASEPIASEPIASEPIASEPIADAPVVEEEPVAEDPAVSDEPETYDGTVARTLDLACPTIVSAGWTDVPAGSTHADGIDCASAWEVFVGGSDRTFSPGTRLSRAQLASVLARAIEQATGTTLAAGPDAFLDDDGSVHEAAIDQLAALGIVGGIDATTYAPAAPVTRAQFASMLARTYRHLVGTLPTGTDVFGDDDGSPHEAAIEALASLGIVTGDGAGSYGPGDILTRAQSATMVARLIDALVEAGATS